MTVPPAALFIVNAVNSPASALAEELEVSEEVAQAWMDGNATVVLRFWQAGESVKTVELEDGGIVTVGDTITVWFWVDANDHSKGTKGKAPRKIVEIKTADEPGTATLFFDDGPDNKPLEARDIKSVFGPIPDN